MTETLEHLRTPILVLATLTGGLQAGTYYTWASGVMPGLARTGDGTFIETMQSVNVAIVNPVFLASFLGAPALALAAVASGPSAARTWAVAGLALAVATVVITGAGNIPLNDALEAAGKVGSIADLGVVRADFETAWVRWNIARTLTSSGAVVALAMAAVRA